jgi:N utilization substance protein B
VARRRARELAFSALFQADRGGADLNRVWREVRSDQATGATEDDGPDEAYGDVLDAEALDFAERLVHAYRDHAREVDDLLERSIRGWSFGQMAQTDLNVLRLAVTEMRFEPEIPPRVTIEMAVRLAKRFGGEESGRFVNGVLAGIHRTLASSGENADADGDVDAEVETDAEETVA